MDILLVTATALELRAVLSGLGAMLPPAGPGRDTAGPGNGSKSSPLQGKGAPGDASGPVPASGPGFPAVIRAGAFRLHPLVCGVGPINAAFALGSRLAGDKTAFSLVLNMGIAGSYDPRALPLGTAALASSETWPEYGLADARGADAEALGFALLEHRGNVIFNRIGLRPEETLNALGLGQNAPETLCPSVTVAGCSATPEQAARIRERTGGLMENMEGFALALGCLRHEAEAFLQPQIEDRQRAGQGAGEPLRGFQKDSAPLAAAGAHDEKNPPCPLFVEIRSISNVVGQRPPQGWDMPAALESLGRAARNLFAR